MRLSFDILSSGRLAYSFHSHDSGEVAVCRSVLQLLSSSRWKLLTGDSKSCSELVEKNPILSEYYQPPWLKNINVTSDDDPDTTDIDMMMAVYAMEKLITRNLLMLRICSVPGNNKVWSELGVSEHYDFSTDDIETCWKGETEVNRRKVNCLEF